MPHPLVGEGLPNDPALRGCKRRGRWRRSLWQLTAATKIRGEVRSGFATAFGSISRSAISNRALRARFLHVPAAELSGAVELELGQKGIDDVFTLAMRRCHLLWTGFAG